MTDILRTEKQDRQPLNATEGGRETGSPFLFLLTGEKQGESGERCE